MRLEGDKHPVPRWVGELAMAVEAAERTSRRAVSDDTAERPIRVKDVSMRRVR